MCFYFEPTLSALYSINIQPQDNVNNYCEYNSRTTRNTKFVEYLTFSSGVYTSIEQIFNVPSRETVTAHCVLVLVLLMREELYLAESPHRSRRSTVLTRGRAAKGRTEQ